MRDSWLKALVYYPGQVDAPVVATGIYRNFQTANEAFHYCLKIAQTPFPFPYAQFVMLALCLYTLFAPLLICQIVNGVLLSAPD